MKDILKVKVIDDFIYIGSVRYKNLGWMNGWDAEKANGFPYEYRRCCDARHEHREVNISKCQRQVFCDTCWLTWKYDSGD